MSGVAPQTTFAALLAASSTLLGYENAEALHGQHTVIMVQENSPQAAAAVAAVELAGAAAFRLLHEASHTVSLRNGPSREHDDVLTQSVKLVAASLGSKTYPPCSVAKLRPEGLEPMKAVSLEDLPQLLGVGSAPDLFLARAKAHGKSDALLWRTPPSLQPTHEQWTTISPRIPIEQDLNLSAYMKNNASGFAWNCCLTSHRAHTHLAVTPGAVQAGGKAMSTTGPSDMARNLSGLVSEAPQTSQLRSASGSTVVFSSRLVWFATEVESRDVVRHAHLQHLYIPEAPVHSTGAARDEATRIQHELCEAIGKFSAAASAVLFACQGSQLSAPATEVLQEILATAGLEAHGITESDFTQTYYLITFVETVLSIMQSETGADLATIFGTRHEKETPLGFCKQP